jgi:hypothetical protein
MPTRRNRCFLLQILLLVQHVSGTIIPIIRSSRLLHIWLPPVVFGAWFSSCRYGMELRVVCPVCTLFHPAPGSKQSSNLHKMYQCQCTAKNSWWWTERLPETCRVVIPIKLEFSASVGFIHKDSYFNFPVFGRRSYTLYYISPVTLGTVCVV